MRKIMKTLVLGGTGLLGQAIAAHARERGWPVTTAARSGADIALDVTDTAALDAVLLAERADLVVNCAALLDVARCEADPGLAYRVNARPVAALAGWSRRSGGRLMQISTDHFYPEGGSCPHAEDDPVELVNEYARTKFAAEAFALSAAGALVFRTSIVGIRGWEKPTLAEWAIRAVMENQSMELFTDAFTSSIDVGTFARAALDIVEGPAAGLINLASASVYSKARFVHEIAAQLGKQLDRAELSTVRQLQPRRAASLGLDVRRAQALLTFELPTLPAVVAAILETYQGRTVR